MNKLARCFVEIPSVSRYFILWWNLRWRPLSSEDIEFWIHFKIDVNCQKQSIWGNYCPVTSQQVQFSFVNFVSPLKNQKSVLILQHFDSILFNFANIPRVLLFVYLSNTRIWRIKQSMKRRFALFSVFCQKKKNSEVVYSSNFFRTQFNWILVTCTCIWFW